MAPKIVDKEQKKMEIVLAAFKVFARLGVAKTKMIDIARAASIGKGTIYEYFSSKEEIFLAGYNHFFDDYNRQIEQALARCSTPREQLDSLIHTGLSAIFDSHTDLAMVMLDFWAEGIRNKDQSIDEAVNLKGMYRTYRAMVVDIFNAGMSSGDFKPINPLPLAASVIAMLDGLMLQWVMEPEIFDVKKVADTISQTLLEGIAVK